MVPGKGSAMVRAVRGKQQPTAATASHDAALTAMSVRGFAGAIPNKRLARATGERNSSGSKPRW
jgi:hypothetical protein